MENKFNWRWFVEKLVCYIALAFVNFYYLIPSLEEYVRKMSLEQMTNKENIIQKMNLANAFIDASGWILIVIALVLFWQEVVFVFRQIRGK